jgi:hypothetical protein
MDQDGLSGGSKGMRIRVGLGLGGPAFTGGSTAARASLGEPTVGPAGLLRDLELRLGFAPVRDGASARLPRWTARIESLGDAQAFYARSLRVDTLGTAEALLAWRDGLVEAGWDGAPIDGGGDRLAALAAIERHASEGMPLGDADRLVRVERALGDARSRLYDSVTLLEDRALWPRRWQNVLSRLEALGTSFGRVVVDTPGAPTGSDLGLLQDRLRGGSAPRAIRGDGTLLLLRADTPGDLAELTAALLARGEQAATSDVVVRCGDAAPLEAALARHGLAGQGLASESAWRPAMQVLPLAVELAFEPRDPYRVLELLTLSVGPFRGRLGARLARALSRQPGIGGKEWKRQKAEAVSSLEEHHARLERANGKTEAEAGQAAREVIQERLAMLDEWLEGPGADASGISREDLTRVVERVRAWLRRRLRGGEADVYAAAYARAEAFADAVAHDTRAVFSREDARQLLDRFARGEQSHRASPEGAGRIAHVTHPGALLAPCDRVFVWGFVAGVERRPARLPWTEDERAALGPAGVVFPDATALLRSESDAWRRSVLVARRRVVFIVPRTSKGTATAPHPLWDEICGRLGLDESALSRIAREPRGVLENSSAASRALVPLETWAPLALPAARSAWALPAGALCAPTHDQTTSVTSLEKIATCPLAWVLEHRADLRSGAMSEVAEGPLLNGGLSHRLVEELHEEHAFDLAEDAFLARAANRFEGLLRTEGATLLLPGASVERLQLTRQVLHAMRDLYRYLRESEYRIAGVEESVTTESVVGPLHGRLDLRLVDAEGEPAVLDLKWGASTYRDLLAKGRAVQLAVYVRAVSLSAGVSRGGTRPRSGVLPPAAYYALSSRQVLSVDERMKVARPIDGPSLERTWSRVEATAKAALDRVAAGVVDVSGTKRSLPLLEALGVSEADRDDYFETEPDAACRYCGYGGICGRRWEAFT